MDLAITPIALADVDAVSALAHEIWHRHYPEIITPAQIDYMLAERYGRERLREELQTPGLWWDQAFLDGRRVGFAATYLTAAAGEMKLDKLYVHPDAQRRGVGSALIDHVTARARREGCATLILAVNKRNAKAIAAYVANGFVVRDEVCVDIGGGFVMDDYILAKTI